MSVLLNWRFWVGLTTSLSLLLLTGWLLAGLVIKPPPEFLRSTFFEFALPPGWTSYRDSGGFTCMPDENSEVAAIMIIVSKERSADDYLNDYLEVLKKPKKVSFEGEEFTSEVIYARNSLIGEYEWLDAVHLNGEWQDFHTRYLASVTTHLGMLITFTVHKDQFEQVNEEFEKCIASIKIYQSPSPFHLSLPGKSSP